MIEKRQAQKARFFLNLLNTTAFCIGRIVIYVFVFIPGLLVQWLLMKATWDAWVFKSGGMSLFFFAVW